MNLGVTSGDVTIPRTSEPCDVSEPVMSSVISPEITSLGLLNTLEDESCDGVTTCARANGCMTLDVVTSN